MKVIDLLNKIANNEEVPKKIKWFDRWKEEEVTYIFDKKQNDYDCVEYSRYLFNDHFMTESLTDEIEIIEEKPKKIEKLRINDGRVNGTWENGNNYCYTLSAPQTVIIHKINEIIDYLLEKESDK